MLVEVENGAADIPRVVRALDEAGIAVEALELVRPTLDDVFVDKTGYHLEEESEDERRAGGRDVSQLASNARVVGALGVRSVRQTFRRPQLIAPIIIFPTLLLAIQTGGAGAAIEPARLPAGPELPPVHARRGDDAVADAGRQQRRHRARGRHRDGLHRPPLRGADPALRDRPRPARRDRRAGPLRGALVPRDRADLRRHDRKRRRRGAAGDRPGHRGGDGGRRHRRRDRPAHRQRQRRPGPLPAGPRRPLPLLRLLPRRN